MLMIYISVTDFNNFMEIIVHYDNCWELVVVMFFLVPLELMQTLLCKTYRPYEQSVYKASITPDFYLYGYDIHHC